MPRLPRTHAPRPDPSSDDSELAQQMSAASAAATQERQRRDVAKATTQALDAMRELTSGLGARPVDLAYTMVKGKPQRVAPDLDSLLRSLAPVLIQACPSIDQEAIIAALNGTLGDRLARHASALAIEMGFRSDGRPLTLTREALAASLPWASDKPLLLIHDLCMNDHQWRRDIAAATDADTGATTPDTHDHGAALAGTLGFTPIRLRYASGLHVSTNARALALQIERLLHEWPGPIVRFAILAHGMGGLLARSALHYARAGGLHWPHRLDDVVFLGTPHHGASVASTQDLAPLLTDTPFGEALAQLGIVSACPGLTDLRHGNLLDEDWMAGDRLSRATDRRVAVPLPAGPRCHAVAGVSDDSTQDDGLVSVSSALGRHRLARRTLKFAPDRQRIFAGTTHARLLSSAEVFDQIRRWLAH